MRNAAVSLLGFLVCQLTTHASVVPSFTGLGDLPGGDVSSWAYGISADGTVVVGHSDNGIGEEAFRWSISGGMSGLGYLPEGASNSLGRCASSDGSIIAGYAAIDSSNHHAVRWVNGTIHDIGTLPGNSTSGASDMTSNGAVVVGTSSNNSQSSLRGFRWQNGVMSGLNGAAVPHIAQGVSDDGNIIAGLNYISGTTRAFRWTAQSGRLELPDLPGGQNYSRATEISADGAVIVGSGTSSTSVEAVRWSGTSVQSLGLLPLGHYSVANDVSHDGSRIVGVASRQGIDRAFIWDTENGIRELQIVLTSDFGLNLSGWLLEEATAITPDGDTIAGMGINPLGRREAWIATIPEPSTFLLCIVATLALSHRGARP